MRHVALAAKIPCPQSPPWPRAGALGALVALLTMSSLAWVFMDRSVWPWDQAWYGEVTLDLWQARHGGFIAWLTACLHAMPAKPPLLVWIAQFFVPVSRVTGDVESALLLVNSLAALATLIVIAVVTAEIGVDWSGRAAAVLLCGGASLFIGMTHQFMVEMLQALTVAVAMLVAVRAPRMPLIRLASLMTIAGSAAVLAKTTSVLFVGPLAAYAAIAAVLRRSRAPKPAAADLFAAFLALGSVALAILWYLINWSEMLQHVRDASTGGGALLYGSPPSIGKLVFWSSALALAIAPAVWLGVGLALLSGGVLARAFSRLPRASLRQGLCGVVDDGTLFAAIIAATTIIVIVSYSLQPNEETRFLTPLLPILAVLAAWSLGRLATPAATTCVLLLLAANAAIGHLFAHGANPFHLTPSVWLKMANGDEHDRDVLTRSVRATCPPREQSRYTIVGVEYPSLNANSAAFYSAKDRRKQGYRCYYTSLGYAEIDAQRAFARIFALDAAYAITILPSAQPSDDAFNRTSREVAEKLAADARFTPLPADLGVVRIYAKLSK